MPKNRLYTRTRNGVTRFYGDFRDYADVGGRRESLIAGGTSAATTDRDLAETLMARRLVHLKDAHRRRVDTGVAKVYGLKEFGSLHLKLKQKAGVSSKWLDAVETQLQRSVDHFGKDRELSTIRPSDVGRWVDLLRDTDNGRGGTLTDKTIRDHLNSLSNLYHRAGGAMEAVPARYNPVLAWLGGLDDAEKPTGNADREAEWFEPHEAALLLEAGRTHHPPTSGAPAHNFIHPLLATALLTGGCKSEILGLKAEDVSFDRDVIRFQPNEYRRLKTPKSTRTVPM